MEEEDSLVNYQLDVYSSLIRQYPFMGIGETAFGIIACFTMILVISISKFCILIGFIAVLIMKQVCKNEPNMVDFVMNNLNQSDVYIG